MDRKDRKTAYEPDFLSEVPVEDDYSLEEILAEYGNSREQKILRDVEREAGTQEHEENALPRRRPVKAPPQEAEELLPPEDEAEELPVPESPRPITLKDVVSDTVSAVMEEQEPLLKPKRGLFSRRPPAETEELYENLKPIKIPEPEEEVEEIGVEPGLSEVAAQSREQYRKHRMLLPAAFLVGLIPSAALLVEQQGIQIPYWTGDMLIQRVGGLTCLLLMAVFCWQVFVQAVCNLLNRRCSGYLLISLNALATVGDYCICLAGADGRAAVEPFGAVSCLALLIAQWGLSREKRGEYDTYRAAAVDETPPYLVTETARGACKQQGSVKGFYTFAEKRNASLMWQAIFLPVVMTATVVFAGLTTLGEGRGADFLLHWSVILAAGGTFSLPLCWGLPYSGLAAHLQRAGGAVAGWEGAERISKKKTMVLTDTDLFPPGTIRLNGVKVYSEEMSKAAAYAAAMTRAAGCGLERLMEGLAIGEGSRREEAANFSFYEEGGYSATIRGESVLLGTASFMRKMDIRMPGGINLKTGIFLAVDRQMIAVFAVKYEAAENVDYALRILRRCRITPVLASRDPNITPALLKRKFHKGVRVEYPGLTSRVALSEAGQDRGLPSALLFREGLLPYAETVAGSRCLCSAVHRATILAILGSMVGTLLTTYLLSLGAYQLLTPLALEAFLLLWALPVLLMAFRTSRY